MEKISNKKRVAASIIIVIAILFYLINITDFKSYSHGENICIKYLIVLTTVTFGSIPWITKILKKPKNS